MNNTEIRSVVLAVDDAPVNLMVIKGALRNEWQLLTAENGEQALKIATGKPQPDLILLDIMMPGMDGYEVCRRLKADPATMNIPIIFVTAKNDGVSEEQGLQLGAIDYISKPINAAVLRVRVRNHIKLKLYQTALEEARRQAQKDLEAAATIQRTLLPTQAEVAIPGDPGAHLCWSCTPCEEVGGDLVAIFPWDNEHTIFYLLDVTGHGPKAAMITFAAAQFLLPSPHNLSTLPFLVPAAMIQQLEQAFPLERFESFFTIIYGVLRHSSRTLTFCNAGQPTPLLLTERQPPRPLAASNGSLVGMGLNQGIKEEKLILTGQDRLLFYTDGLIDVLAPDGQRFGETLWPRQQLELSRLTGARELVAGCNAMVSNFRRDTPLADDLTILALACNSSQLG